MAWIYVSTKVDTHQQRREIVEGGVGPVAGCKRHGWRAQASRDGFTASPATGPTLPSRSKPAFAFAVAVEVAGQRPALPRVQGAALPNTPAYILLTNG